MTVPLLDPPGVLSFEWVNATAVTRVVASSVIGERLISTSCLLALVKSPDASYPSQPLLSADRLPSES